MSEQGAKNISMPKSNNTKGGPGLQPDQKYFWWCRVKKLDLDLMDCNMDHRHGTVRGEAEVCTFYTDFVPVDICHDLSSRPHYHLYPHCHLFTFLSLQKLFYCLRSSVLIVLNGQSQPTRSNVRGYWMTWNRILLRISHCTPIAKRTLCGRESSWTHDRGEQMILHCAEIRRIST